MNIVLLFLCLLSIVIIIGLINHIYETKFPQLPPANKQLVGKIQNEHSLFFNGEKNDKMHSHNLLTHDVLGWFEKQFIHYLNHFLMKLI